MMLFYIQYLQFSIVQSLHLQKLGLDVDLHPKSLVSWLILGTATAINKDIQSKKQCECKRALVNQHKSLTKDVEFCRMLFTIVVRA